MGEGGERDAEACVVNGWNLSRDGRSERMKNCEFTKDTPYFSNITLYMLLIWQTDGVHFFDIQVLY